MAQRPIYIGSRPLDLAVTKRRTPFGVWCMGVLRDGLGMSRYEWLRLFMKVVRIFGGSIMVVLNLGFPIILMTLIKGIFGNASNITFYVLFTRRNLKGTLSGLYKYIICTSWLCFVI